MKRLTILLLLSCTLVQGAPVDPRYCGPPKRLPNGVIARSTAVLNTFKEIHPCPSTAKEGACPGWSIDHVIPLACGGCDSIVNMQWLPTTYKLTGKDRWERKIYDRGIPDTPNCSNEIVK